MDYLSKFNDTFQEMIKDLIQVYPDDSDFRFYQLAVRGGLMADEYIVNRVFHENIHSFEDKILDRDESFFLEKDYKEFESFQDVTAIVSKLKNCWKTLTPDNKDVVWKYLKVLILLDKKINA